jgi:peroxiredoxin
VTIAFYVSYAALWILVIFQTLVMLGLTRTIHQVQTGAVVESGESLQGKEAPSFSAVDLFGSDVSNESFAGQPTALLFVSPDCEACALTLEELEALESKTDGNVLVFCRSNRGQCEQLAATYGLQVPVIVDEEFAISRLFRVAAAPTAVLIDENGKVESYGEPVRPEDFQELLSRRRQKQTWEEVMEDRVGANSATNPVGFRAP